MNEQENLYEFPSFPNLSPEEHRRLSHTACLTFHCAENLSVESSAICYHLDENTLINPATGSRYNNGAYFGPHDTSIDEFLKLPEISCIVYPTTMTDSIQKIRHSRYRSYISILDKQPIYDFRFCIVQCLKEAAEQKKTLEFGGVSLKILCEVFNNHNALPLYFGHKIYPRGIVERFNLSLMEALCCFCSREIVVRLSSSNGSSRIRLRNDPDLLLQRIDNERVLAVNALQFYERYIENNPNDLNWDELKIDVYDLGIISDLTFVSSYPSFFLDNVYAALHHYESVVDYETLHKAIFEYCEQDPDIRLFRRLTDISVLNLLIEMVSPEALEAVEKWKNDKKKNIYMKIANELASKLNAIEADFVLDFIELFPQKSRLLLILDIWAINRIAKCVLFASAHPTFITENDMISKILDRYATDICGWMKKLGIISFEALFVHPQVQSLLAAVIVKKQNGENCYRNMASIMYDGNLVIGFPFTTRKLLLNCLQQGILMNLGENGFISETFLYELYHYCYKKLDDSEWLKLFGSNYDTIQEFLEAFGIKEIQTIVLSNGELGYGIHENFKEAYPKVIKEKRICYEAVRIFLGIVEQMKKLKEEPLTTFTAWKRSNLNFEIKVLKSTKKVLSRAKTKN